MFFYSKKSKFKIIFLYEKKKNSKIHSDAFVRLDLSYRLVQEKLILSHFWNRYSSWRDQRFCEKSKNSKFQNRFDLWPRGVIATKFWSELALAAGYLPVKFQSDASLFSGHLRFRANHRIFGKSRITRCFKKHFWFEKFSKFKNSTTGPSAALHDRSNKTNRIEIGSAQPELQILQYGHEKKNTEKTSCQWDHWNRASFWVWQTSFLVQKSFSWQITCHLRQ